MKHAVEDGIEERLLAQTIARREQLAAAAVVDRKGEHAFDAFDARRSELLVGVEDGLGIGHGSKAMALGFEQRPQIAMVVNLAVENNPKGYVLVCNWLW